MTADASKGLKLVALLLAIVCSNTSRAAPPSTTIDIADLVTTEVGFSRLYGSQGDGFRGVPIAAGPDVDGDGAGDYAMASMLASAFGRSTAGLVYLAFGGPSIIGSSDTGVPSADVLAFGGAGASEMAGSELWMDDVTGDGTGDLLIARQNHTPSGGPIGAGALTIVVGGTELRSEAANLATIDLASPPSTLTLVTIIGVAQTARLGIWMRTGDVTGDGIADIVVGADQESPIDTHAGAAYIIRGGSHLLPTGGASERIIDLSLFPGGALPGHVKRIAPPSGSSHLHFGATVQIADLDNNGMGEVLAAGG